VLLLLLGALEMKMTMEWYTEAAHEHAEMKLSCLEATLLVSPRASGHIAALPVLQICRTPWFHNMPDAG
jgi:hypothetical protein